MTSDDLNDEQLLFLVGTTDKELFDAGMDIKRRDWEVPLAVMNKLGHSGYVLMGAGTPKILERIRSSFASIYRKQDIAMGGHIGVFMYRDIFARIGVPMIFGEVEIDPFEFVELTPSNFESFKLSPTRSNPTSINFLTLQTCNTARRSYWRLSQQ